MVSVPRGRIKRSSTKLISLNPLKVCSPFSEMPLTFTPGMPPLGTITELWNLEEVTNFVNHFGSLQSLNAIISLWLARAS